MKFGKIAMAMIAVVMIAAIPRFARAQSGDDDDDEAISESDKADAVVKRHKKELRKIPHVVDVESDDSDSRDVVINVEVDKQKNVDEVARKVPARIEGFAVDVVADDAATDATGDAFTSKSDSPAPSNQGESRATDNVASGVARPDPAPATSPWLRKKGAGEN